MAGDEKRSVDVSLLDIRVGLITEAKKHEDADSLYVEQVDLGEDKPRTVVSGLVKHIPLEQMQNRRAVFLCNLKPAKMRGVLSEAMVMCASTEEKVEILEPPPDAVIGDRVTFEGYPAPDLKTDSDCVAKYKDAAMIIEGKGVVKAPSLKNVQIR
ncbi:hypothetical protein B4U79_06561 [Dinothrombium tinctorium]|uniref:tRNA-binding domain-containing protein n=1 Tax=Dinothrombium tinctorium TaxID=1965070 RepID=A0A3S3NQ89_9ACAR|nr:hypothetical protein B4U79_06561 [Dinothrombium tinctorium]